MHRAGASWKKQQPFSFFDADQMPRITALQHQPAAVLLEQNPRQRANIAARRLPPLVLKRMGSVSRGRSERQCHDCAHRVRRAVYPVVPDERPLDDLGRPYICDHRRAISRRGKAGHGEQLPHLQLFVPLDHVLECFRDADRKIDADQVARRTSRVAREFVARPVAAAAGRGVSVATGPRDEGGTETCDRGTTM